MKIGERIRKQRNKLGFSLRELGALTSLIAGFLSQIENDQISPSLNSLHNIAAALQASIFYFLDEGRPTPVVKALKRSKFYFPDSHIGYELFVPELNRQMLALLIGIVIFCVTPPTF